MGKITHYLGRRVLAVPTQVFEGHTCLGYEGAFPEIDDTSHFSLAHLSWAKPEVHCAGMVNVTVSDIMGTLMFVLPTNVVASSCFALLPSGILCLAPLARDDADRFPENDAFARKVISEDTFLLDTLPAAFRARWVECGRPTCDPAAFFDIEADEDRDEPVPNGSDELEAEGEHDAPELTPVGAWFFVGADSTDAVVFEFEDHFVTIRHITRPAMDISMLSKERCASAAQASTIAFKAFGRLQPVRTGVAELFRFAIGGEVLS